MAISPEIEAKLRAAAAQQAEQTRQKQNAQNRAAEEAQKQLNAARQAEQAGNLDEAYTIYTDLYNRGFVPAAFFLGNLYLHRGYKAVEVKNEQTGQAVRRPDFTAAEGWYRKAADRGVREAMCNLGVLLVTGEGDVKNPEEGKKYLLRARDAGSEEAKAFLFQNFPDQRSSVKYTDEEYTEMLTKFIGESTAGNAGECHRLFFGLVCGSDEQLSSLGMVLAMHKYSANNPFVNRMYAPAYPKLTNGMPCAPVYLAKRVPGASTLHLNPGCFPDGAIRLTLCSTEEDLTVFPLSGIEDMADAGTVRYRTVPLGSLPAERTARILEITPEEDAGICIFTENGEKSYIVELGWLDGTDQLHILFRYSVDIRVPDNPGVPQVLEILPPEEIPAESGEGAMSEEPVTVENPVESENEPAGSAGGVPETEEKSKKEEKSGGFFRKHFKR